MKFPSIKDRLNARLEPQDKTIVMHHQWRNLLFLHWEIDKDLIQQTLPPGLYTDTFNNKAYIGITPFMLKNLKLGILPPIPGISDFPEINVRTYVFDDSGIPGIWFYSLDADNLPSVKAAHLINLPYVHSDIAYEDGTSDEIISFSLKRNNTPRTASKFSFIINGKDFFAESDSLEFFLIERYYLFTYLNEKQKLNKIQVHHNPYPLCSADLLDYDSNLLQADGFSLINRYPDHIIMSPGVDVNIYNMK